MLKSVDEYNYEKQKARLEQEELAKRTGVACPKCGQELLWCTPCLLYGPGGFDSKWRQAMCSSCRTTVDLAS